MYQVIGDKQKIYGVFPLECAMVLMDFGLEVEICPMWS